MQKTWVKFMINFGKRGEEGKKRLLVGRGKR
jgi:hypothetical protein